MADRWSKQTLSADDEQQLLRERSGDEGGARQSLARAVESLRIRSDDGTNSGGPDAAALDDSGRRNCCPATDGSDDCFDFAREQGSASTEMFGWKGKINELLQAGPQHPRSAASSGAEANTRDSSEKDDFQCSGGSAGTHVAAGVRDEEDWESVLDELPEPRQPSYSTACKDDHSNGKSAVKQRGRGSFTNGAMGLYSDYFELNAEENDAASSSSPSDDSIKSDASCVLVLDCSSKITTKDVEDVVEPFSKEGSCAVRWVDNTRALASFSSPSMAREALVGINDGRFNVSMLSETDVISGGQRSLNEAVQSVPRPASSAKVAQRMITSALSRPGLGKQLRAKNQGSLQEIQEQERQRKQRLQLRAQLRDEAWGSDDD